MYRPYSSLVWLSYKKMSICKLQITSQNILKMNIGLSKYESTSATCAITNTQCCQSVIRNLMYKFVCRLDKSKSECSNEQHFEALNVFYEGIVGILTEASKKLSNRRRKHSNQSGWNDHVADLHKDARECFVMWCYHHYHQGFFTP